MGTKTTGMTAMTTPASGDLIPIVDVSDTAQSASGSTRKVTFQNLISDDFVAVTGDTMTGLLTIDQNSNAVGLSVDSEATTQNGILVKGKYPIQTIQDISNGYGIKVYRNINEAGTGYLAQFVDDHSSNTAGTVSIQNDGTGIGAFIDQNGNGVAFDIDSEVANDGIIMRASNAGTSPSTYELIRNDDVTGNMVLKLGTGYVWVDTNGDLRVHSSTPTSDTGGTIVGTQS